MPTLQQTIRDPWLRLRLQLAQHGLRQWWRSLGDSSLMILLLSGPALLTLPACFALPALYAPELGLRAGSAVWCVHLLLQLAPLALLRKHLLPATLAHSVRHWPLTGAQWWRAHLLLSGLFGILWLLCGLLSCAFLWLAAPPWLAHSWHAGLALLLGGQLLVWLAGALLLQLRLQGLWRQPRPLRVWARGDAMLQALPPLWRVWYLLYLAPGWRLESRLARQQALLWLASGGAFWLWRSGLLPQLAALPGVLASALLLLQADRGVQAMRTQAQLLAPTLARWPLAAIPLQRAAALFALLPSGSWLLLAAWQLPPGRQSQLWLAVACAVPLLLALLTQLTNRNRIILLFLGLALMAVAGAEIPLSARSV